MRDQSIPGTQPYDVEDVYGDLLNMAGKFLKKGGRLVFLLPTNDGFTAEDLPIHPCLRLIALCRQVLRVNFNRYCVIMEKYCDWEPGKDYKKRNKLIDPIIPKWANLKEPSEENNIKDRYHQAALERELRIKEKKLIRPGIIKDKLLEELIKKANDEGRFNGVESLKNIGDDDGIEGGDNNNNDNNNANNDNNNTNKQDTVEQDIIIDGEHIPIRSIRRYLNKIRRKQAIQAAYAKGEIEGKTKSDVKKEYKKKVREKRERIMIWKQEKKQQKEKEKQEKQIIGNNNNNNNNTATTTTNNNNNEKKNEVIERKTSAVSWLKNNISRFATISAITVVSIAAIIGLRSVAKGR